MKKFLISLIFVFVSLFIANNIYAISTVEAKEEIDLNRKSSLTINYHYDDYNFDGINVKIYYVAKITSDLKYELSSSFLNSNIKIGKITSIEQWNLLKESLNTYIEDNNIKETLSEIIKSNKISVTNLEPGLYFVKTETIDNKNYSLIFNSFLVSVPNLEEDGTWNYEISVYPKAEYTDKNNTNIPTFNPQTSDNIQVYFIIMIASLLTLFFLILKFKYRK